MANAKQERPQATRSPSELKFVLRNAQRKSGPEVFRDLARSGGEERAPTPKRERDRPHRTKTLY